MGPYLMKSNLDKIIWWIKNDGIDYDDNLSMQTMALMAWEKDVAS